MILLMAFIDDLANSLGGCIDDTNTALLTVGAELVLGANWITGRKLLISGKIASITGVLAIAHASYIIYRKFIAKDCPV